MKDKKQNQISEAITHVSADFVSKESNRRTLITVLRSNLSPDGKRATIFISVLPEAEEGSALAFMKRSCGDIRKMLSKKVQMRILPFLDVELDYGEKNRQRIDELLREAKK